LFLDEQRCEKKKKEVIFVSRANGERSSVCGCDGFHSESLSKATRSFFQERRKQYIERVFDSRRRTLTPFSRKVNNDKPRFFQERPVLIHVFNVLYGHIAIYCFLYL
jgi:hypothetical protein